MCTTLHELLYTVMVLSHQPKSLSARCLGTSRGSLGFANSTSTFNPSNANTAPSSSTYLTTSTTPDHNVLCNQLEHNLYLASPQPQEHDICTPEAIYEQIVHECSEFEQRSNVYNDVGWTGMPKVHLTYLARFS